MIDKLKDLATHPVIEAITALILILVGLNHMAAPTESMLGSWLSALPDIVIQLIGLLITANGGIKGFGILNR